ncbi:hypothetical protein N781_16675 [Pontibacillus halophilus JSM 076056 = DSM 19796]|uniref:Uncharacterized protein n=1 Tax=Pontibacillus halophilus JSM 076056 = DSM 19796 TaxID=1385510 RepID=A0A0A5I964_9BACI|nr:hypothetical protein [Pontibacillus halophilus]KGX92382.1 hypothetical protein N781_16675 [Pontibacillus halophilus JSM 076056 = DSM 19796]
MSRGGFKREGAWVQAVGTVLAAIGSTPTKKLPPQTLKDFNVIGNTLQATGNGLATIGKDPLKLGTVGNEVQAIGNTLVIAGLITNVDQRTKDILNTQGNLFQATGAGVGFADAWEQDPSISNVYLLIGNLLQVVGNGLQAIFGNEERTQVLDALGSWIQAVGAVLTALGEERDYLNTVRRRY